MERKVKTTKNCRYCQSEIPAKATVCPSCGKRLNRPLIIAIEIVLLLYILYACTTISNRNKADEIDENKATSTIQSVVVDACI